jgi:methylated-DNA-[protein]-cysteine S-methyltransferase
MQAVVGTPFGPVTLFEAGGSIVRIRWGRGEASGGSPVLEAAAREIGEYIEGVRRGFDVPVCPSGSEFQRAVWGEIAAIPFGDTRTYGEIAQSLGVSAQAVGRACGANPVPILIPCHRVMGARGLTGYSGGAGVETKLALLRHEGAGGFLI